MASPLSAGIFCLIADIYEAGRFKSSPRYQFRRGAWDLLLSQAGFESRDREIPHSEDATSPDYSTFSRRGKSFGEAPTYSARHTVPLPA
jgi:hypothetical protein